MLSIVQSEHLINIHSGRRPYKKRRGKQIIYNDLTEEEIKEYKRRYYKEYRERNRELLKQSGKKWRAENKEYYKKYTEENKQRIKDMKQIKIICDICNCSITRQNKNKHYKTQKHINNQLLLNRS